MLQDADDPVVLTISYSPTEALRCLGELRDAAAILWLVAREAPNGQKRPILGARNRVVRISADLSRALGSTAREEEVNPVR